jgi:tRNA pseudouridine55 synthase
MRPGVHGILLLDKPVGMSSSGATQRVRRLLGGVKAGHVGSLDPLATGMLPICLGEATKVAGEILDGRKTYRFTVRLGARTATGDSEGEVVEIAPVPDLTHEQAGEALGAFLGESEQVPPMFSALKRNGEPLYRLARRGITVDRPPRRIRLFEVAVLAASGADLDCRVTCSKGTYIRVLAEDLARRLGSCGHVVALRREAVEPFESGAMITLAGVESALGRGAALPLVSADVAVAHLQPISLAPAEATRLLHGQAVALPAGSASVRGTVRLYRADGSEFLGLGLVEGDGFVRPKRLFAGVPA